MYWPIINLQSTWHTLTMEVHYINLSLHSRNSSLIYRSALGRYTALWTGIGNCKLRMTWLGGYHKISGLEDHLNLLAPALCMTDTCSSPLSLGFSWTSSPGYSVSSYSSNSTNSQSPSWKVGWSAGIGAVGAMSASGGVSRCVTREVPTLMLQKWVDLMSSIFGAFSWASRLYIRALYLIGIRQQCIKRITMSRSLIEMQSRSPCYNMH